MEKNILKVGVASMSHPPEYQTTKEREDYVENDYKGFCNFLERNSFNAIKPLLELRKNKEYYRFGISSTEDCDFCINYLKSAQIDCFILQVSQWTRVPLAVNLIKSLDVPTAIIADTNNEYAGEATAISISASVLESAYTKSSLLVRRFQDYEEKEIIKWLKGTGTLQIMKKSRILNLGGSYGADIPFTRDDEAVLESKFIKEIIFEEELSIIEAAKRLLKNDHERIIKFLNWLIMHKVNIVYDNNMLTEESLEFQVAQYLATRDKLKELQNEGILGISIKCHYEVSTKCIGCTECLIAGFLPFNSDSEGDKPLVSVACEGDIKGLITNVMLSLINPEVPPLFGDMVKYKKDYIAMSNCGSSSVYWAGRSLKSDISLPKVSLLPQIHGKSGSAVHYLTPAGGEITFARLFRIKGQYFMHLGKGEIIDSNSVSEKLNSPWPKTYFRFNSDHNLFFKTSPCNHGCITEGDYVDEIEIFCRDAGVTVIRSDINNSMEQFINNLPNL